jgi:hypothetical protein
MDELYKQLLNLFPVIIGGLIVWIGTFITDRRKISSEKRMNLRTSYAKWFTSERKLRTQIEEVITLLNPRSNIEETILLLTETKKISSYFEETMLTSHEILLLETNSKRCGVIKNVVNCLDIINKLTIKFINTQKELHDLEIGFDEKSIAFVKYDKSQKILKEIELLFNDLHKEAKIRLGENSDIEETLQGMSSGIKNFKENLDDITNLQNNGKEIIKTQKEIQTQSIPNFRSDMLKIIYSIRQSTEIILDDLSGKL